MIYTCPMVKRNVSHMVLCPTSNPVPVFFFLDATVVGTFSVCAPGSEHTYMVCSIHAWMFHWSYPWNYMSAFLALQLSFSSGRTIRVGYEGRDRERIYSPPDPQYFFFFFFFFCRKEIKILMLLVHLWIYGFRWKLKYFLIFYIYNHFVQTRNFIDKRVYL